MNQTALVAIGGNSLITDPAQPDIPHQWDAVRATCRALADMVEARWDLVVTHGNGPQVGFNLRRSELAATEVYPLPLDLIVAHTQGSIGYMLQQALGNELWKRGVRKPVVTVLTQVLVAEDDPAFASPTKPIGRFMSEEEAERVEARGVPVVQDAGRGWRRVVASPRPLRIMERGAIRRLVQTGCVVIAAGGGGIPVVRREDGELRQLSGVPAVIDKDLASGLLAQNLGLDMLIISTTVEYAYLHYGTPQQEALHRLSPHMARRYLEEGQFAAGSMAPKIEALASFVSATGKRGLISNPAQLATALHGESGTWVVPECS